MTSKRQLTKEAMETIIKHESAKVPNTVKVLLKTLVGD